MHQQPFTGNEVDKLRVEWDKKIAAHSKYWLENDAKLRAISSAKSYEEFSDIVKAAHLKPVSKRELSELGKKRPSVGWDPALGNAVVSFNSSRASNLSPHDYNGLEDINTAAKFGTLWNRLDNLGKMNLLKTSKLDMLGEILKQDTPPGLVSDLTKIYKHDSGEEKWITAFLKILVTSKRFQLHLLFLTQEETYFYSNLLQSLSDNDDTSDLKREFGCCK